MRLRTHAVIGRQHHGAERPGRRNEIRQAFGQRGMHAEPGIQSRIVLIERNQECGRLQFRHTAIEQGCTERACLDEAQAFAGFDLADQGRVAHEMTEPIEVA